MDKEYGEFRIYIRCECFRDVLELIVIEKFLFVRDMTLISFSSVAGHA